MSLKTEISAYPAKTFFVSMLTRDISLEDTILDLLDNCIDGVLRTLSKEKKKRRTNTKPYEGFHAEITLNKSFFRIVDNCGGIPRDIAEESAFRMGRMDYSDEHLPTVGVYGIGMKRALFKMGRTSEVLSKTTKNCFKVTINSEWLDNDKMWELPIEEIAPELLDENGTAITVTNLYEPIGTWFDNKARIEELRNMIASHFGIIILKGFSVTVNGVTVKPVQTMLLVDDTNFNKQYLAPYIYTATINDVNVLLEVGFYRDLPDEEEVDEELKSRRSKENAGWTIVCNDRVVLHKDKTILTGWGDKPVPAYHSQFIAIAGIVFFSTNHAEQLPITTTKRGIDASSEIYLHVRQYMKTGMKMFTDQTNHWKTQQISQREVTATAVPKDIILFKNEIPEEKWKHIKTKYNEEKVFRPDLPRVQTPHLKKKIQFSRLTSEIRVVAKHLFGNPELPPSQVGEACFEKVLKEIK